VRKPQGYATVTGDFRPQEYDTMSCGHCNKIVMVKAGTGSTVYILPQLVGPHKEEPGACCRVCMRGVCLQCDDLGRCLPLERKIEQMESRNKFLQSVGV
jgi:hypothetical protein